jgi:DNA replication protein DnaD
MQGWIKLHRKIQEHWLYQEERQFSRYEAWIDLIMMANHKQTTVLLGNELVQAQRGQVITSEHKLMKKWKWGKSRLRAFLEMLQKEGMITKKSDRKKTVITICNYNIYHDNEFETEPHADHGQTISGLKSDTIKNVKNVKNNKYSPKQVYDETSPYYQLATFFLEQIRNNNPEHKTPNLQKWSDEIRKMVEIDKRTIEQVKYLMQWVQQDDFEMINVLSPTKLRKRFDQLVIKVKKEKGQLTPKKQVKTDLEEHYRILQEQGVMD